MSASNSQFITLLHHLFTEMSTQYSLRALSDLQQMNYIILGLSSSLNKIIFDMPTNFSKKEILKDVFVSEKHNVNSLGIIFH